MTVPGAHLQIEVGLDAFFHARYGTPSLYDVVDREPGFATRAYARTVMTERQLNQYRGT